MELSVTDWTFPITPESGGTAFTWAQTVFGVACAASKEMNTMRIRGCIMKAFSQTNCSFLGVRRVEKVANQRHGFRRPLFHQPMPGASNDHLSNIGRHVAHDHRLQWTKRLLSAYSQYGHGQLHLLEDFVVLRVLRKSGELSEPSPHPTRLRIGGRKKVSGGLIGLGGIAGEIIPYAIEVDALTTGHKPFGVRPVKVEMPNSWIQENLIPRLDARNRCIQYYQPLNLVGIHCSVRVRHRIPDVVCNNGSLVISQPGHDGANVLGLRLLVIPRFRL